MVRLNYHGAFGADAGALSQIVTVCVVILMIILYLRLPQNKINTTMECHTASVALQMLKPSKVEPSIIENGVTRDISEIEYLIESQLGESGG